MFSYLFREKPTQSEPDPELELARMALMDRVDDMLARDIHRKLRHTVIAAPWATVN